MYDVHFIIFKNTNQKLNKQKMCDYLIFLNNYKMNVKLIITLYLLQYDHIIWHRVRPLVCLHKLEYLYC